MTDIAKIADVIKNNNSFAIAVHVNPDSDCLGSSSALLLALRAMNKEAKILLDGNYPKRISHILGDDFLGNPDDSYDVCIAVDVASTYMMGNVYEKTFKKSSVTCLIDHHGTNEGYADYNWVDANAAAAAELVYVLIKDYLDTKITASIAERIYTAIASDTGSFQYSNTTSNTHIIASELLKYDFDAAAVMRNLFEKKTIEQLQLKSEVISTLEFYFDGKVCFATVDNDLLKKYSMSFENADDLASLPRSIEGVEIGVYVKVRGENEVKFSLRSNEYADVSKIAQNLGGGGHVRAAGVTVNASKDEALKMVLDEIKKVM